MTTIISLMISYTIVGKVSRLDTNVVGRGERVLGVNSLSRVKIPQVTPQSIAFSQP